MTSDPYYSGDPGPAETLNEISRVHEQVRARRWWYVAEALLMSCSLTLFYVALHAWPDLVDRWFLTGVVVMTAVFALLGWRRRSVPAPAQQWEGRALGVSFVLVFVCVPVYRFLLPDGFSLWVVLAGLLPGLPFAVLAWKVGRS